MNQPTHKARPRALRSLRLLAYAGILVATLWAVLWTPDVLLARQGGAALQTVAITAGEFGPAAIPSPTADVTLTGEIFSQFGFAVSAAGDVNGDGIDDLLVGADGQSLAFVYTGTLDGLAETPFAVLGPYDGRFGTSLAGGGALLRDLDGDGVDDFLVGAPYAQVGAAPDVGMVYVYTGSAVAPPTLAITLTGEASSDRYGWAVALAGDVNGDDYGDIVVGAFQNAEVGGNAGKVYIYHGGPGGITNTATLTLLAETAGDGFGVSVAGLGDVNGDTYDDIAVGAWQNADGGTDAGKVYVYYGGPDGIDVDNPTTLLGVPGTLFGTAVHAAGDVNGDGYADLVVGADAYSEVEPAPGQVFVFLGSPTGIITTPVFVATGESTNDRYGFAVGGGGDLNGDGFADVLVGANEFSSGVLTDTGKAYAYAGCLDGVLAQELFSGQGQLPSDRYGRSVAIAGDLNQDGYDDLVVGAFAARPVYPGPLNGYAYVYYGAPVDVCAAHIVVTKTVGLADYPPACGPSAAIPTPTDALTVPVNTAIAYCYTVENTGNLTLTHHSLVDDGPDLGTLLDGLAFTLTPGMSHTHVVTRVAPSIPASVLSGTVTWTASVAIRAPGGAETIPPNAAITTTATAAGSITVSPVDLDQDNDGTPDNEEGALDGNGNGLPAYLDPGEFPDPDPDPEDGPLFLPVIVR